MVRHQRHEETLILPISSSKAKRQTDTERADRQTDKQNGTGTDKETNKQTNKQINKPSSYVPKIYVL